MSSEPELHFISALFIFFSASIPIYLSTRVSKELKGLTIALSVFILVHGIYHVLAQYGYSFLSEIVFEPLSVAALIGFGLMYLTARKNGSVLKTG